MIAETAAAPEPRRTKRRGRHPHNALAPAFVRNAPPGHHIDGNGLYLYVQSTGARSWIQRLVIRGKRCELGLGSAALVSLAEARDKAVANRKLARSGGDPLADKRRLQSMPTFAEATASVVEQKQAGWKNAEQVRAWRNSLRRYAFPRIGTQPVSEVTSADVLAILSPIWYTKPVIAKAVRQRLHAVLEWAIAMNLRNDNPADRVRPVLGPQRGVVTHMRALPHREVAAALAAVRASRKQAVDKLAFEFLVLTAARSGEVRFAAWDEMDSAGRVWTLSAARMKMKRDHRVPLCSRAVGILDEARTLGGGGALVFPAPGGGALDVQRLRRLLKRCGISCVPHGFRSSFRDWAAEETDHPREVIEAALAHVVQNQVEAAYARSDLFERRRRLMNDWADYLAETSPEPPGAEAAKRGRRRHRER
ncbi:MAG: integrase arm-type DNA-binding domain-containing protein [Spirochaetaceae bacterium]|nr:integrase arm-type DNA-binding domain-containing protein [Spirochaetaceae bacterium]